MLRQLPEAQHTSKRGDLDVAVIAQRETRKSARLWLQAEADDKERRESVEREESKAIYSERRLFDREERVEDGEEETSEPCKGAAARSRS
jgi:hypothetical protein